MKTGKKPTAPSLAMLFLFFGVAVQAQETGAPPASQDTIPRRSAAAAEPTRASINGIYSGAIDNRQVVLEIGAVQENTLVNDETRLRDGSLAPGQVPYPFEGRYLDRQQGIALLVEGRPLPGGSVRLRGYERGFPTGAEWRLTFTGDHAEGIFCQCDVSQENEISKPQVKIALKRVSTGFDPNFDWDILDKRADQAYYDLLLDFPLKNGPEVRVNGQIAYVIQTDPRFQVSMPRLTRFPDKAIMQKVNIELETDLEYRRLWAANCAQSPDGGVHGGADDTLQVTLTRNIMRIRRKSFYICGWPAPKTTVETKTYDMRTGKSKGSL